MDEKYILYCYNCVDYEHDCSIIILALSFICTIGYIYITVEKINCIFMT